MMQDPILQQMIGQNPQGSKIMASLASHMAEHAGLQMRQKMEQQLGMALPPEDEKLPPQLELALSGMMAQAANQVLMQDQAQAAQMQAQQQAQDPVLQMQQQELAIRKEEVEVRKAKAAAETSVAMAKVQLEQEKIGGKLKLDAMKVGMQMQNDKHKIATQDQQIGLKAGIDIAKSKEQLKLQRDQLMMQSLKEKPTK
jgi:hypothetical protein